MFRLLRAFVLVALLVLPAHACEMTMADFNAVHLGMSYDDVRYILGSPSFAFYDEKTGVAAIPGNKIMPVDGTIPGVYVWKTQHSLASNIALRTRGERTPLIQAIFLTFDDGKVSAKKQQGLR